MRCTIGQAFLFPDVLIGPFGGFDDRMEMETTRDAEADPKELSCAAAGTVDPAGGWGFF